MDQSQIRLFSLFNQCHNQRGIARVSPESTMRLKKQFSKIESFEIPYCCVTIVRCVEKKGKNDLIRAVQMRGKRCMQLSSISGLSRERLHIPIIRNLLMLRSCKEVTVIKSNYLLEHFDLSRRSNFERFFYFQVSSSYEYTKTFIFIYM